MTRRPSHSPSHHPSQNKARRLTPDDSYQLDAVVSLFAMILVILVTTAAATSIGTTFFAYRSADAEGAALQPAGLAAPFPRPETWILRGDELMRLDLDATAQLLLASGDILPLGATDPNSGIDLSFDPSQSETGAYEQFKLTLPTDPLTGAGGIIAARLDPTQPDDITQWATGTKPIRMLALTTGQAHLPALSAAAEAAGRPMTIRFLPGNRVISERRLAASFTFRGILRSH